jgi:hypothetical protein
MQKGVNSKEHGSLRVASKGVARSACTIQVEGLKVRSRAYSWGLDVAGELTIKDLPLGSRL